MSNLDNSYQLILEINKLKTVFRNNQTTSDRRESSAEHSWSTTMICLILMPELKQEFPDLDETKIIHLALTHDLVEIYAGDVSTFNVAARVQKAVDEADLIQNFKHIDHDFGSQIVDLWKEFESQITIEAKIAKAADAICPIFLRVLVKQSLKAEGISQELFESRKLPYFIFSQTFTSLYHKLKSDLLENGLV